MKKIKIGIITCHRAYNYGAVLQCYALLQKLKSKGYDVFVIDYVPPYLRKISSKYRNNSFAKIIRKIVYFPDYSKSKLVFGDFLNNNLKLTKRFSCKNDFLCSHECNLYIAGSDQIWNPILDNGWDDIYQLGFTKRTKISYAASIGVKSSSLSKKFGDYLVNNLSDFDHISVREYDSLKYLESLGLKASHVCDPVFLLDRDTWIDKFGLVKKKSNYVVAYILHHDKRLFNYAKRLAYKNNYKLISISTELRCFKAFDVSNKWNPKVETFLELIMNANSIVTNSFHGMSFGVIFKKPLHIAISEVQDNRIADFVKKVDLHDRMIKSFDKVLLDTVPSDNTYRLLKKFVNDSESFLSKAVNNV